MHPNIVKIANKWFPYTISGYGNDRFVFPLTNRSTGNVDKVFIMFIGERYTSISGSVTMGYSGIQIYPIPGFNEIVNSRSLQLDSTQFDQFISAYLSSKTHIYYKPHITKDIIADILSPIRNRIATRESLNKRLTIYSLDSNKSNFTDILGTHDMEKARGEESPYVLCYTLKSENTSFHGQLYVTVNQIRSHIVSIVPSYYLPPDDGKIIDFL